MGKTQCLNYHILTKDHKIEISGYIIDIMDIVVLFFTDLRRWHMPIFWLKLLDNVFHYFIVMYNLNIMFNIFIFDTKDNYIPIMLFRRINTDILHVWYTKLIIKSILRLGKLKKKNTKKKKNNFYLKKCR